MIAEWDAYVSAQDKSNAAYAAMRDGTGTRAEYEAARAANLAAVQAYAEAVCRFTGLQLTSEPLTTAADRLSITAQVAGPIAAAQPDLAARHVVWRAREIADELITQLQTDWDAVTNPGDEVAMNNARTG